MKRAAVVFLSLMFILTANINVFAYENGKSLDENVAQIMKSQLPENESFILKSKDIYEYSMESITISNKTIFKIYATVDWYWSQLPLETMISKMEEQRNKVLGYAQYIVFDDIPYKIRILGYDGKAKSVQCTAVYNENLPTYLSDIYDLKKTIYINGESCNLDSIYLFDGEHNYDGIVMYLKTDKGVFLKYYEDSNATAVLYTETEFQKYATDYYNYLVAHAYDENGNPVGGANMTFGSFVKNPPKFTPVTSKPSNPTVSKGSNGTDSQTGTDVDVKKSDNSNSIWLWLGIGAGVCVIAAGTVCCVVLIRRKKINRDID